MSLHTFYTNANQFPKTGTVSLFEVAILLNFAAVMTKNSNITVPKLILQRRFLLQSVLFVSLFSMLFMAL